MTSVQRDGLLDKLAIRGIIPAQFHILKSSTMNTNGIRAAIYLRVSRDDQTTENQRLVLEKVAGHRGWAIILTYEDAGISGAKGRDQRSAFDAMLNDAVRRKFDILMVWSIDRLGRSVLHVANALAELDAVGTVRAVERELSHYPKFRVIDIWAEGERDTYISDEAW